MGNRRDAIKKRNVILFKLKGAVQLQQIKNIEWEGCCLEGFERWNFGVEIVSHQGTSGNSVSVLVFSTSVCGSNGT